MSGEKPINPATVYLVSHAYMSVPGDDEEDARFIGCFSTLEKADTAVQNPVDLPGFREHVDGFLVEQYLVDIDVGWEEGFITVSWDDH